MIRINRAARAHHEIFIQRCLDLAKIGVQGTAPNPMVGAVIVYNDRIIGEGFHAHYGQAHAEVLALESVCEEDRALLQRATMYVSLEPCCYYGKTPPCTGKILDSGIPRVVICMSDPNPRVSGRGIAMLKEGGVKVETGILEKQGRHLLRMFRKWVTQRRPYVVLKFVQSRDGFIGVNDRQVWLSNAYEKLLVHKMRSEFGAIMVGTNTAIIDNPQLTTRNYHGASPLRVILDRTGRIPHDYHVFNDQTETLIFSETGMPHLSRHQNTTVIEVPFDDALLHRVLEELGKRQIMSLMVEGGARLINSFRNAKLWDEAWVVTVQRELGTGVQAPVLEGHLVQRWPLSRNILHILTRN